MFTRCTESGGYLVSEHADATVVLLCNGHTTYARAPLTRLKIRPSPNSAQTARHDAPPCRRLLKADPQGFGGFQGWGSIFRDR